MTVPAAGEILAQIHEARKLAQGFKVFREARAGVFDLGRIDELAPGFVREKRERAKFAAAFEVSEDFSGDALLILERMLMRKLRAEFEEGFLRVGGLVMNEVDEADELISRLVVGVVVLAGVNGGELPFIFPGEWLNGLS